MRYKRLNRQETKPVKVSKKKTKIQTPGPDYSFTKSISVLLVFLIANYFPDMNIRMSLSGGDLPSM